MNLCQERCVNGLPCSSSRGGPLPPCTVTMRAPEVTISLFVKPSSTAILLCRAIHIRPFRPRSRYDRCLPRSIGRRPAFLDGGAPLLDLVLDELAEIGRAHA